MYLLRRPEDDQVQNFPAYTAGTHAGPTISQCGQRTGKDDVMWCMLRNLLGRRTPAPTRTQHIVDVGRPPCGMEALKVPSDSETW